MNESREYCLGTLLVLALLVHLSQLHLEQPDGLVLLGHLAKVIHVLTFEALLRLLSGPQALFKGILFIA